MKMIIKTIVCLFLLLTVVVLCCNLWVDRHAEGRIYMDTELIPHREYGLLLGAPPLSRYSGRTNMFFVYRIRAAAQLYQAGKVDKILISGDEHSLYGANEVQAIRDSLRGRGVPDSVLVLDGKGLSTLDSVVRMCRDYRVKSCTIISQKFHNERAIFLADYTDWEHALGNEEGWTFDEETLGYNAKSPMSKMSLITYARELFARVKAVLDLVLKVQPEY